MGEEIPHMDSKVLKKLETQTSISKKQLKEMYDGFKKEFPSKFIDLSAFKQLYAEYFPDGSPDDFADHVYRQFDSNGDGVVDFRELIVGVVISHWGSTNGKKRQIFEIYDINANGVITREEMLEIISALYKVKIDKVANLPQDCSSPEKAVDKIYSLLDKDQNGELSFEEFVVGDTIDSTGFWHILFEGEEILLPI